MNKIIGMISRLKDRITRAEQLVVENPTPPSKTSGQYKIFSVGEVSFKMIKIPAGTFMMGSPESEPERRDDERQHKVKLTRNYWMGETEVTQELWGAVMGNIPSFFRKSSSKCPVETVSWDDAQEFIRKLNGMTGVKFRLPTEAEWEYAARAGTTTPFHTGNCLSTSQANYNGEQPYSDCPKGYFDREIERADYFEPNAWGLYDMHGNVSEWCQDWYGDYPSGPVKNPTGPKSGSDRVHRGGGWWAHASWCRSAFRSCVRPGSRSNTDGFRLAGSL